ncbi:MAG: hypothetical protein AAGD04_03420 [Pseudomonadota bacterium]
MTQAVSAVMSEDNVAKVYGGASTQDLDQNQFMEAFDKGLDTLSARPEFSGDTSALDQISGAYGGDVGVEKADIISETSQTAGEAGQAKTETMESRFQSLYFELTHYQVAWRIAQSVQRDISQVLRGS